MAKREPTCVTIQPGGAFLHKEDGRLVSVPYTHHGLNCELCEWFLLFPSRVGVERIEEIRQRHLGTVHFTELVKGRAQISEDELTFSIGV